jgi:hypothetical protein
MLIAGGSLSTGSHDPYYGTLMPLGPSTPSGQVKINHCLVAVLQVSRCFGDGGVSPALRAEAVTAGMEGRLEDRLQDLEHRLLNHPVHDVRNAQSPLPAAQTSDDRRSVRFRRLDRLSVNTRCSLVTHHVQQRPGQIGFGRRLLKQLTGVSHAGAGTSRFLVPRFMQQKAPPPGCVRWLGRSAPRRAVGEHEAQLPWSRLSQSISPFAPPAFTGFVACMERSDFPVGIVRLSLPPSGLPLARTHVDLPE